MTALRWLANFLLLLFACLLFLAVLGFVLANPHTVELNLLLAAWPVPVGLGAGLVVTFLAGLLLGVVCGLLLAVRKGGRAKSRSAATSEQTLQDDPE